MGLVGFELRSRPGSLASRVLRLLEDGPLSLRDLVERIGDHNAESVYSCLKRLWRRGLIVRTRRPVVLRNAVRKGPAGVVFNVRAVNY